MKRFISMAVFCLLPTLVAAEEMNFITVLAQPLGSFAAVEANSATINTLNLGIDSTSSLTIKSSDTIKIGTLNLAGDTTLTTNNVQSFQVDTLNMLGAKGATPSLTANSLQPQTGKTLELYFSDDMHQMTANSLTIDGDVTSQVAALATKIDEKLTITDVATYTTKGTEPTDNGTLATWAKIAKQEGEEDSDVGNKYMLYVKLND